MNLKILKIIFFKTHNWENTKNIIFKLLKYKIVRKKKEEKQNTFLLVRFFLILSVREKKWLKYKIVNILNYENTIYKNLLKIQITKETKRCKI